MTWTEEFMKQKGFTLVEVLTVIIIIAVLATMAIPMYEKAIERSHIAEARTVLKQMLESKLRTLALMNKNFYVEDNVPLFGIKQLDLNLRCPVAGGGNNVFCQTKDFRYTLLPSQAPSGKTVPKGVSFLVEDGTINSNASWEEIAPYFQVAVCAARCGGDYGNTSFLYVGELTTSLEKMFCSSTDAKNCQIYGMEQSDAGPWCNCD